MTPRVFPRATALWSVVILLTGAGCTAPESHIQLKTDAAKDAGTAQPGVVPVARETQVEPRRPPPPAVKAQVPTVQPLAPAVKTQVPAAKPKPEVVAQPVVKVAPADVLASDKLTQPVPTTLAKADILPPSLALVAESSPRVPAAASSLPIPAPAFVPVPPAAPKPAAAPAGNPYLVPQQVGDPVKELGVMIDGVKGKLNASSAGQGGSAQDKGEGILGPLKLPDISQLVPGEFFVLPKIKTVYPTGEKPLVIVTFKCPTEIIGITPLPTKALHDIVTWGMDSINSANVLDFNMQQVCQ